MWIRRYLKMRLVKIEELDKFLKLNPYKFKWKDVAEYSGTKVNENLKKYCL